MEIIGLKLPMIKEGDDLAQIILSVLENIDLALEDDDIVLVTEKIVSKSQGRLVDLETVVPTVEAKKLADATEKDPRIVELILQESREIVLTGPNFIITETLDGFVCANAGIDSSNVVEGKVKLLPLDPDRAAEDIRRKIEKTLGKHIGVVISDSFGRPFRLGSVGVAIGASGLTTLWDRRGETDLYGRTLESTRVAVADCIASAVNLVTGDGSEGIPVAVIKGLKFTGTGRALDLIREKEEDKFR